MSVARTSSGSARTVLRFVPHLGLLLAVIAVVLLALVPIGWRGGWVLASQPDGLFGVFRHRRCHCFGARPCYYLGRSAIGRRGIAVAILASAAGGLTAYVPRHYRALARSVRSTS